MPQSTLMGSNRVAYSVTPSTHHPAVNISAARVFSGVPPAADAAVAAIVEVGGGRAERLAAPTELATL